MPQKVVGLDIGSYSIKAALFETSFSTFRITDLFESRVLRLEDLSDEEKRAALIQALAAFCKENQLQTYSMMAALSGSLVSSRLLQFPFKDPKQIEKILPFELEGYLPFSIDDLVISHNIVQAEKTSSSLLAFALRKEVLAAQAALFAESEIEAPVLDVDSLALGNITQLSNIGIEGSAAILDIGHSKSSVCIVKNGVVQSVRSILTAGLAVTDALRKNLDLTLQQAEEVKHKYSCVEIETEPIQDKQRRKIAAIVQSVIDPLINDVMQMLHNYESSGTEEGSEEIVQNIYLCGGSSLIKKLPEYLTQISGKRVQFVRCRHGDQDLGVKVGKKEPVLVPSIAIGLRAAMRGSASKLMSQVNFRKGEFAAVRSFGDIRERVRFIGLWAAAVFVAICIGYTMKYQQLSHQVAKLEERIIKDFELTVPDLPKGKITSSKQALSVMNSRIKEYSQKVEMLTSGLKAVTALDVLNEISSRIPREISVDVLELSVNRNKIFMRGDTDSFSSVDKIVSFLKEYEHFGTVTKGAITDAPDPKKKRFTINIVVGDK